MFATDKIGSTMTSAMRRADAAGWFGAAPPDLSVEARVRGTDWLYSYLNAFYRDDTSPTGWNNLVFKNVSMPHVLWNLSGANKLVETEYDDSERPKAPSSPPRPWRSLSEVPTASTSSRRWQWTRRGR